MFRRNAPFNLPTILDFRSPSSRIAKDLELRDLLAIFKRMRVRSYFSRISVSEKSFVQQTNVYRSYWGGGPDPSSRYALRTTSYFRQDPLWIAEVTMRCDSRYMDGDAGAGHHYKDRGARSTQGIGFQRSRDRNPDPSWKPAWFDQDVTSVRILSDISRNAFEASVRELLMGEQKARAEVCDTGSWAERGLEAIVLCRCGHQVNMDVNRLTGGKLCENVFALQPSLRCSACGDKGQAEILPAYRPGFAPAGKMPPELDGSDESRKARPYYNNGVDLYEVAGGDGTQKAYLGDGTSIGPDGKLFDG
ncbi:hypothetical protein [Rubellimicrobium aerolatum]|uniref:Uncharacterized protein n=1 Tax=Rubellimicrobium aerolatum TaxID=490979 RepID=A0ABW0SGV8_9RHOB|nr:hypothetical protein [Rubellimicrobium aerolatum]MBP1807518.1 hypothetical protein [Rubellimicrobium aerolatum]